MSKPKTDPLGAFFEAESVPEVDVAFRTRVMEAVNHRRLRIELALRLVAGFLLVLGFMAIAPALEALAASIQTGLTEIYVALVVSAVIAASGHYLLRHQLPTLRIPQIRIF